MKTTIKIGVIAVNKQNEVLLIKEKYTETDGYCWNIVKGTYDNPGETLEECAKRELREEAGLDIDLKHFQLREVYNYGNTNDPKMLFVFYVYGIDTVNKIVSSENKKILGEHIIYSQWFSKSYIEVLPESDYIANYVYFALKNFTNTENNRDPQIKFYKDL